MSKLVPTNRLLSMNLRMNWRMISVWWASSKRFRDVREVLTSRMMMKTMTTKMILKMKLKKKSNRKRTLSLSQGLLHPPNHLNRIRIRSSIAGP